MDMAAVTVTVMRIVGATDAMGTAMVMGIPTTITITTNTTVTVTVAAGGMVVGMAGAVTVTC